MQGWTTFIHFESPLFTMNSSNRLQGLTQKAVAASFRTLSTRVNRRGNKSRYGQATPEAELPQFSGLLRQFYKQTHPDLLRATHNEFADVNDQSWQTLNGILSTCKEMNSFPPRMTKSIPFYMRSSAEESGFRQINLRIKTAGGDCRKQLTVTLSDFFVESGISEDGKFVWGKDYFPSEVSGRKVEEDDL